MKGRGHGVHKERSHKPFRSERVGHSSVLPDLGVGRLGVAFESVKGVLDISVWEMIFNVLEISLLSERHMVNFVRHINVMAFNFERVQDVLEVLSGDVEVSGDSVKFHVPLHAASLAVLELLASAVSDHSALHVLLAPRLNA